MVPISAINPSGKPIASIVNQDNLGKAQPVVYIDDISLDNTPLSTPTPTATPIGGQPFVVYADAVAAGWGDSSWGATVNWANTSPVHGGKDPLRSQSPWPGARSIPGRGTTS